MFCCSSLLFFSSGIDGSAIFNNRINNDGTNADNALMDGDDEVDYASITDWYNFDYMFRGWVIGDTTSGTAIDSTNRGIT